MRAYSSAKEAKLCQLVRRIRKTRKEIVSLDNASKRFYLYFVQIHVELQNQHPLFRNSSSEEYLKLTSSFIRGGGFSFPFGLGGTSLTYFGVSSPTLSGRKPSSSGWGLFLPVKADTILFSRDPMCPSPSRSTKRHPDPDWGVDTNID